MVFPCGKRSRGVGLTTLSHLRADYLEILGALISWSPKGLFRPLWGLLFLVFNISVPWKIKSRVSSGYQKSCKNACAASGHEGCVTDRPVLGFLITEQSFKLTMIHFFLPTAGTLTGFETAITFVFLRDFPLCSYFCVFLRYVITSPPAVFSRS